MGTLATSNQSTQEKIVPWKQTKRSELPNIVFEPQKLRRNFSENRISSAYLREHCRRNDLYMTPRFNTVLYLHFKGLSEIENLEEYTGLKCLWFENNFIKVIKGLDHLAELKCLFLHENRIEYIAGLTNLVQLVNLNLANNFISSLSNLADPP